jgi:cysteine desulfurase/selenocysteine lyase
MVASAVLFLLVNTIGTTGFMLRSRVPGPWVHWTRATTVESGVSDHRRVAASSSITEAIGRNDFPILETEAHPGKKLVFLDSAASSQKPRFVLDAMDSYYKTSHANVHRGAHALAVKATEKYEDAREQVRQFVNAGGREEIIFTRGATDAINLVAMSWAQRLQPGDEIILSEMEHHSNLVPWQMAAQRTGAVLKVRGAWTKVVTFLR